jgi:hypothetical protein
MIARNAVDALAGARNEGDAGATSVKLTHEREAETGCASCDGNSEIVHGGSSEIVQVAHSTS